MNVVCPKRTERRDPGRARVTARDLLILRLALEAQPITVRHVRALTGLSSDMAKRRLRVLVDLGMLRVHLVGGLQEANRYTLTEAARQILARAFGWSPEEVPVLHGISRVVLDHHEATVDVFVSLTVACARSKRLRLVRFLFERDIRRQLGGAKGALVPDAAAEFVDGEGRRFAVAFEVDRGTENPSWVATHKGLAYAALQEQRDPLLGCADWRVGFVIGPSLRRLHRLASALWQAGVPEGLFHLALTESLDDRAILERSWVTPRVAGAAATLMPSSPFATVTTNGHHSGDGCVSLSSCDHDALVAGGPGSFRREEEAP